MKQLFPGKQMVIGIAIMLGAVFGAAAPIVVPAPVLAAAPPAPGDSCPLPDGASDGKLQADLHTCCPASASQDNSGSCLFAKYINPLINLLAGVVGVVVVVAIIIGGIEYSSSAGDPQRAASGKQHIMNALLGLLAYILLYAFLQFLIPGGVLHG